MKVLSLLLTLAGYVQDPPSERILTARAYEEGFSESTAAYKSLLRASDGKIYYALSSTHPSTSARIFSFDPSTQKASLAVSLEDLDGKAPSGKLPQGVLHVDFFEHRATLYTASHTGLATPFMGPEGHVPYPGGHLLSLDLKTRALKSLARAPEDEGIVSLVFDPQRV